MNILRPFCITPSMPLYIPDFVHQDRGRTDILPGCSPSTYFSRYAVFSILGRRRPLCWHTCVPQACEGMDDMASILKHSIFSAPCGGVCAGYGRTYSFCIPCRTAWVSVLPSVLAVILPHGWSRLLAAHLLPLCSASANSAIIALLNGRRTELVLMPTRLHCYALPALGGTCYYVCSDEVTQVSRIPSVDELGRQFSILYSMPLLHFLSVVEGRGTISC